MQKIELMAAKQIGLMSCHGEKLGLTLVVGGEAAHPESGEKYDLREAICRLIN
jgi:UDP-2-acetamido-3-amino-2,3-dideoxy-glucuronate N-acetyltransferase